MRKFDWDIEKNKKLIEDRNISFEEVIVLIEQNKHLDIIDHPNLKYKHQKMFVLDIDGYVYLVPYVENNDTYFLKTIFPSRKMTKDYLNDKEKL